MKYRWQPVMTVGLTASLASLFVAPLGAQTAPGPGAPAAPVLSPVEVRTQAEDLSGQAIAGSEGVVSAPRLATVPLLRPGEALELVPGLIVTQHAGDGKANQYFLRGFNLDHGTDFATYVGGVPVNMPSHAHGQGYTDLNFLIPELIERIHYRKGPYAPEDGDFSSAGSARMQLRRRLDAPLAQITLGGNGYARTLLAGSAARGSGDWLYALEAFHHDGPWQVPEHYRRLNGILRYSDGTQGHGLSITGMASDGRWTSTDQVPQRAINAGLIDRYGSLDASAGGQTRRASLAAEWGQHGHDTQTLATAWLLRSGLDLWSNFTYCAADMATSGNCTQGDQFLQHERRTAAGVQASHSRANTWGGRELLHSVGVQARTDHVAPLGLYGTQARSVWATVREDRVRQHSVALWAQTETRWSPVWRSVVGLRADAYAFDVASSLAANSGRASQTLLTPKLALIATPLPGHEWYANYGHGFHSNDARGTTLTVDPNDPTQAAQRVPALVRTRGVELGWRAQVRPGWRSTLALWRLDAASELLFVGDAGTTEPSRPSRRWGVEWSQTLAVNRWLALDADLAWSQARFRDADPAGPYIPGAVGSTANLGVSVDGMGPWSGALRVRAFGARPLIEDNSQRAAASVLVNLRLGYRPDPRTTWSLDVYNLANRRVNDIEYAYESQLRGEAAPVLDRHLHPSEPRSLRLTWTRRL